MAAQCDSDRTGKIVSKQIEENAHFQGFSLLAAFFGMHNRRHGDFPKVFDQRKAIDHLLETTGFYKIGVGAQLVSFAHIGVEVGIGKGHCRDDAAFLVFVEPGEDFKAAHAREFHLEQEPFGEWEFLAVGELTFRTHVINHVLAGIDKCIASDADTTKGLFVNENFARIIFGDEDMSCAWHFDNFRVGWRWRN